MHSLIDFFEKAVNIIYPLHCLGCNKLITQKYFCDDCKELINHITVKTCPKCGLPNKQCVCRWNFYYFDENIACLESDEATKTSFYSFKFRGNYVGGRYFASEMAERIKNHPFYYDIDLVTSVPSHKSALRKRGYDQVKVLAKNISKIIQREYVSLLCQPKKSPKQHETTQISERFENVVNKYTARKNEYIKNKTILLVDDIKTTGATLSQCARELKLAGAKRVIAISALTVYPKEKNNESKNYDYMEF